MNKISEDTIAAECRERASSLRKDAGRESDPIGRTRLVAKAAALEDLARWIVREPTAPLSTEYVIQEATWTPEEAWTGDYTTASDTFTDRDQALREAERRTYRHGPDIRVVRIRKDVIR